MTSPDSTASGERRARTRSSRTVSGISAVRESAVAKSRRALRAFLRLASSVWSSSIEETKESISASVSRPNAAAPRLRSSLSMPAKSGLEASARTSSSVISGERSLFSPFEPTDHTGSCVFLSILRSAGSGLMPAISIPVKSSWTRLQKAVSSSPGGSTRWGLTSEITPRTTLSSSESVARCCSIWLTSPPRRRFDVAASRTDSSLGLFLR